MSKIVKSKEEWKKVLSDDVFEVTRNQGTEHPFSGEYNQHFEDGIYMCVCCRYELFDSNTKFNSGCGWPSYSSPVDKSSKTVTSNPRSSASKTTWAPR